MTRFTARIVGPEELTADELRKALQAIGCYLEAQPMQGARIAQFREEPLIPRCSTAPDFAPEPL